MPRLLNLAAGGLAMILVASATAFTTLRLAIHGSQVEVPSLVGMTAADAERQLGGRGLNLVLVSRFYSTTVPAGHIISQVPAPGVLVRQEWEVRAIESLGPQKVSIPDVRGMPERPAAITIRRVSLDLGTIAHLPAPGDAEVVLAQTPPPNAAGVDSPRVSLLLSQRQAEPDAFVMPSLIGLSASAATSRSGSMGLNVVANPSGPAAAGQSANHEANQEVNQDPNASAPPAGGIVVNQSPASGHRVVKGETVRLTLGG